MKEKTIIKIVAAALIISFVANIITTLELWSDERKLGETKTEIVYDTIPIYYRQPVPVDSAVIRYVNVTLPISQSQAKLKKDTVYLTTTDSITVEVPITQKIYSDSTYKAWVSGFQPSLDSICVYQPTQTITITQPIIEYKTKRWGLGVQVGAGLTPSKIEPYVGVGVTYNILSW